MNPDTTPILYACVSKGPTVLAELSAAGDGDLRTLAARCLEAAPRFHLLYTRTVGGRIYAFLMEEPLIFFTIADEALGRQQVLIFLRRLRDAFSSTATGRRRRIDGADLISRLCFQDEFLPVLRQLVLPLISHEDKPPPSPSSPPSDAPLTVSTPSHSQPEGSKRGRQTKVKKKKRDEEVEISVTANGDDGDPEMGIGGRKSAQMWWRRHVWTILLIDLVVCIVLFAMWLSVCRGFHCIGS